MDPVMVAGCGNAGFAAALELSSRLDHPVIAVDPGGVMWYRSRYHRAVETGSLSPVQVQVRPALSDRGVSFREDRLVDVDPDEGAATFSSGTLRFSKLVVAVGATTRPAPSEGRRVLSFRDDLEELLEALENPDVESFVVAGGGATGVHAAGSLAVEGGADDVLLAHDGDRLLPGVPDRASESARSHLEDLGVTVLTGARVEDVAGRKVRLEGEGAVEADRLVWCGGLQRRPDLGKLGLPTNDRGLAVDDALRVASGDVYAAGDCTWFPGKTRNAYYAFHEARTAARNVARDIKGKDPKPFDIRWNPRSIYLGGGTSGLVVRGRLWTGRIPNLVRKHVVEDGYEHMLRWIW